VRCLATALPPRFLESRNPGLCVRCSLGTFSSQTLLFVVLLPLDVRTLHLYLLSCFSSCSCARASVFRLLSSALHRAFYVLLTYNAFWILSALRSRYLSLPSCLLSLSIISFPTALQLYRSRLLACLLTIIVTPILL